MWIIWSHFRVLLVLILLILYINLECELVSGRRSNSVNPGNYQYVNKRTGKVAYHGI